MIKGIIFDLDGTLIDSHYDWNIIRKKIGVDNIPILTYINNLKGASKKKAINILDVFEKRATRKARLQKGIKKLLTFLSKKGIKKAIVTNNSRENVQYLLWKLKLSFDEVVTRDDGVWKPSGKPLELAIKRLRLEKDEVIFIGNSNPDKLAAQEAGIRFISVNQETGVEELISSIKNSNRF